jgi:hypothetical protein
MLKIFINISCLLLTYEGIALLAYPPEKRRKITPISPTDQIFFKLFSRKIK